MKSFKPALTDKLEPSKPIKLSLSLTIIVFIGNLVLHILFMYLYHIVAFVRRMVPNSMKLNGTNVPLNPVVSLLKHLKADIFANLTKQLKKPPTVISPEDMGTLKRKQTKSNARDLHNVTQHNWTLRHKTNWTEQLQSERKFLSSWKSEIVWKVFIVYPTESHSIH